MSSRHLPTVHKIITCLSVVCDSVYEQSMHYTKDLMTVDESLKRTDLSRCMPKVLPNKLKTYTQLNQALIQEQISTSPSPGAVDGPHVRRTDIITYIINNITIKGNYKPNFLAFLLQMINVLHIIISKQ